MELYIPSYAELSLRRMWLADAETMSYNHAWGGLIDFSEERWPAWYDKWIAHPVRRFYRYLRAENGETVGEAAYRFEEERGIYLSDVIIYAPFRRKGYARRALQMLCEAARANGLTELYDDIAIDNDAGLNLFLSSGFSEVSRTTEAVLLKKTL